MCKDLDPASMMAKSQIMQVPITQKERHTPGRHQLSDLMEYGLRHGQRAVTDLDAQQQFGLRIPYSQNIRTPLLGMMRLLLKRLA